MYKHILIATDGSELAAKAVTTGLALAKQLRRQGDRRHRHRAVDGMVTGDPGSPSRDGIRRVAAENAAQILAAVSSAAKGRTSPARRCT